MFAMQMKSLKFHLSLLYYLFYILFFRFSEMNPCFYNPCKHEGLCNYIGKGEYLCICNERWHGRHCDGMVSNSNSFESILMHKISL